MMMLAEALDEEDIMIKRVERSVQSLLNEYKEASAQRKHEILHFIHDEYHALPWRYQLEGELHDLANHPNKLRDLWWEWLRIFEREEEEASHAN
jgi:hypothetical protein